MLRLSKKTDYALLALQHLDSEDAAGVASARAIAERFGIPLDLLAKILQQLAHRGLVAAHKGTHGGYYLARPTDAISIADVVEAISVPMTMWREDDSNHRSRGTTHSQDAHGPRPG